MPAHRRAGGAAGERSVKHNAGYRRSGRGLRGSDGPTAATSDRVSLGGGRCRNACAPLRRSWLRSKPDVIVAGGGSAVVLAETGDATMPIVFAAAAIRSALGSLQAWRGRVATSPALLFMSTASIAKWLELLKELAPSIARVAVFCDPNYPANRGQLPAIASRAPASGCRSSTVPCEMPPKSSDADRAIAQRAKRRFDRRRGSQ